MLVCFAGKTTYLEGDRKLNLASKSLKITSVDNLLDKNLAKSNNLKSLKITSVDSLLSQIICAGTLKTACVCITTTHMIKT